MNLHELIGFVPKVWKEGAGTRWPDYFGVELEIEDPTVVRNTLYWEVKNDGSLRNGVEYVMRDGYGGKNLEAALKDFYDLGCQFTNGPRTSTHIHVTAGDMTVDNLRAMMILMYTVEDALFTCIGETRKWSSYAMPLSEMPPKRLRPIFNEQDTMLLRQAINPTRNQERYYGLNICCSRHGTVEFRYFPGGPTKPELESWLDFVAAVKDASKRYTVDNLLNLGNNVYQLEGLIRSIFGPEWTNKLLAACPIDRMLEYYQEITAIAADAATLQRRQQLVFVNASLRKFVKRAVLKEEGSKLLDRYVEAFSVMGYEDWRTYLRQAIEADEVTANKPKKKPALQRQQLFGEPLYRPRPARAAPVWEQEPFGANRPVVEQDELGMTDYLDAAQALFARPNR